MCEISVLLKRKRREILDASLVEEIPQEIPQEEDHYIGDGSYADAPIDIVLVAIKQVSKFGQYKISEIPKSCGPKRL